MVTLYFFFFFFYISAPFILKIFPQLLNTIKTCGLKAPKSNVTFLETST